LRYKAKKNCFWNSTSWYSFNRHSANGSNKYWGSPNGVFSFGAVAMGIVNLSVVGMGIISAGITTMGIWEYSPNSHNNHHNHSKQISNSNKENMISDLFNTKQEAEKAASKYGCIGAHKMGNKWMPCKMH